MDSNETPEKTLEQHTADLKRWFEDRGVMPIVVAQGKRSGALSPIADFQPDTHVFTFILAEKPNGPNP